MYRRGQWLLRNYWGISRVWNPEYKGCFLSLIFHASKTIYALFIICNSGTIFRTSFAPSSWCIILVFVCFKFLNIGKKKIAQEYMMLTKPMGVKFFFFGHGQLSSTLFSLHIFHYRRVFTKIFTRFWISHDSWSEVKLRAVIRIAKGWPATSAWIVNHIWGFRIPGPLRCFRKKRCLEVLIFGILRYTCLWYMEIVFWISC